ncbi:MAG: TolC family protein [Bacteroidetes bacterium]|nr:TolC family protein [Bacteroidota bacterium]
MLKKLTGLLILFLILNAYVRVEAQQKKGAYKPTKYDSVKKLIPPQYYGNAKEARRADSLAKVAALQKEKELLEKQEMEKKIAEQQLLERKKKKKVQLIPEKKPVEPKQKEVVKQRVLPPKTVRPPSTPDQKKVVARPQTDQKKANPRIEKIKKGPWSLAECIEYAKQHNLTVAESQLNERYAQVLYEESKNSRYPDLNGDVRLGRAFGRNIDPVGNQFVNNNFTYSTAGLQSQMLLFGWFQKKFQVEKNKLELDASKYANTQIEEEISLNIATGFIRVLQARELLGMFEQLLKNRNKHLDNLSKNYNAGNASKLSLIADIAIDSADYISAKANERLSILQLKTLMNLDFNEEFTVQTTENDASQIAQFFSLPDVDELFLKSLQNKSWIQSQQLKLVAAKKSLDLAKTSQYPQLLMYGGLGTVFSTNVTDITSQRYIGESTKGYVNIEGSSYPISVSNYEYSTQTRSFANQYGDHIRANIGVGIVVPMLNGYASRAAIQKAKISLVAEQISMDREKLKLKQDIYEVYEEVKAALQQYMAYQKATEKSQKLIESFGSKNADDKMERMELQEAVRNQTWIQSKTIQAKYDLLFKLKKLDYFVGNSIKM